MRLGNNSLLSSIFASSTDQNLSKKEIKLHTDFRADKNFRTCWSGCRVQVWVQVQVPACHLRLAIISEGYCRQQSLAEVLTSKSMTELLGQCSCTAWAGWEPLGGRAQNTECFLVCCSTAATGGSLDEKVLPFLQTLVQVWFQQWYL